MGTCTLHHTSPFILLYILEYFFSYLHWLPINFFLLIQSEFQGKMLNSYKIKMVSYIEYNLFYCTHTFGLHILVSLANSCAILSSELPRQTRLKKSKHKFATSVPWHKQWKTEWSQLDVFNHSYCFSWNCIYMHLPKANNDWNATPWIKITWLPKDPWHH